MALLELEKVDTTAVVRMNNGKNTQDLVFAQTMNSLLEEAIGDTDVRSLVITSTDEKNWSQGIDLEWITQQHQRNNVKDVREFFVVLDQVYSKLMLMPVPTIAAITGHAFGAGAFLATACDYRFMNAHRGFFCFPEIDLKMDFLPGVIHMMIHKLPDFKLPDLVYSGKRAGADELEKHFIVERACQSVDETIQAAMNFAGSFDKDRKLIASYKQTFNGRAAEAMVQKDLEHFEAMQQQ
jgi:enoyl-CoA hydratase/carnithine racemase